MFLTPFEKQLIGKIGLKRVSLVWIEILQKNERKRKRNRNPLDVLLKRSSERSEKKDLSECAWDGKFGINAADVFARTREREEKMGENCISFPTPHEKMNEKFPPYLLVHPAISTRSSTQQHINTSTQSSTNHTVINIAWFYTTHVAKKFLSHPIGVWGQK